MVDFVAPYMYGMQNRWKTLIFIYSKVCLCHLHPLASNPLICQNSTFSAISHLPLTVPAAWISLAIWIWILLIIVNFFSVCVLCDSIGSYTAILLGISSTFSMEITLAMECFGNSFQIFFKNFLCTRTSLFHLFVNFSGNYVRQFFCNSFSIFFVNSFGHSFGYSEKKLPFWNCWRNFQRNSEKNCDFHNRKNLKNEFPINF